MGGTAGVVAHRHVALLDHRRVLAGQEFVALRSLRLRTSHALGEFPLIVLRRGLRTNDVLNQREADLTKLSARGRLVIAQESDHEIQLYQPDLVVQAIRDVISESHGH